MLKLTEWSIKIQNSEGISGRGRSSDGGVTVISETRLSFNGLNHALADLLRVNLKNRNVIVAGGRGSIGDGESFVLDLASGGGGFVRGHCAVAFGEDWGSGKCFDQTVFDGVASALCGRPYRVVSGEIWLLRWSRRWGRWSEGGVLFGFGFRVGHCEE